LKRALKNKAAFALAGLEELDRGTEHKRGPEMEKYRTRKSE
jgi:hypothetical protein